MPKKKDYPKWFSIYSKPYAPYKPIEFINKNVVIKKVEGNCENVSIPEGAISFYVEASRSYDDTDVEITFYGPSETVRNPSYEKEMERYQKEYKQHQERTEEWKILEKKWKAEEKIEALAYKKKLFNKLKKELNLEGEKDVK